MSKYLTHRGYALEVLEEKGISIRNLIEKLYMTFQYSVQINNEIKRQEAIDCHVICGETLSLVTLLNTLELCYKCNKNCFCDLYRDAVHAYKIRLTQLLSRRLEID